MTKAFPRICSIDSRRWIEFIVDFLPEIDKYTLDDFNEGEIRMWQMLQFTIWQKPYEECGFADLLEGFRQLQKSPVMLAEMLDILYYNYDRIDFVDEQVDLGFECPLDLHCTYSRDQILTIISMIMSISSGVISFPTGKSLLIVSIKGSFLFSFLFW